MYKFCDIIEKVLTQVPPSTPIKRLSFRCLKLVICEETMNVENIDSKVELRSNTFTPEMKKCSDKEDNTTSSSVSTPTEGPNHEEIDARSFKKPNGNNTDANAYNGPAASAVSPSQG